MLQKTVRQVINSLRTNNRVYYKINDSSYLVSINGVGVFLKKTSKQQILMEGLEFSKASIVRFDRPDRRCINTYVDYERQSWVEIKTITYIKKIDAKEYQEKKLLFKLLHGTSEKRD